MKKFIISAALLLASNAAMHAQIEEDFEGDDDEITVTDEEGKEEVIEFPEAMTFELDSLLNLYMSKTYLDEDNDCRMKDVNPVFEEQTYIDRLHRMPTIIEMPYNEVVRKFIDRYSGRLRHSVSYMLGASNFYMPIFETCSGVDTLNPQSAEVALLVATVTISVGETLLPCVLGNGPNILAGTEVAASKLQNSLSLCS